MAKVKDEVKSLLNSISEDDYSSAGKTLERLAVGKVKNRVAKTKSRLFPIEDTKNK